MKNDEYGKYASPARYSPPATLQGRLSGNDASSPHNINRFIDELDKSSRRIRSAGMLVILVLIGGLLAWANYAEIAGAVIANGELQAQTKKKPVSHYTGGIVDQISVREGDVVKKGRLLMRINADNIASEIGIIESELDLLLPRQLRLEAESKRKKAFVPTAALAERARIRPSAAAGLIDETRLFTSRATSLHQGTRRVEEQIGMVSNQKKGTASQLAALEDRTTSLNAELTDLNALLKKGLTTKARVMALERELTLLGGEHGKLTAEFARLSREEIALDILKDKIRVDFESQALTKLGETQARISSLQERRAALENDLQRADIRAPEDGTILDLVVKSPGSAIKPAEPLLFIVPGNDTLVIDARINVTDRDKVWTGQQATIVFPGLDQSKLPEIKGVVARIAADSLSDERNGQPFYKVEIGLPADVMTTVEEAINFRLVPGMPVSIFLKTSERTVAQYLVEPLMNSVRHTFREG